ncbi:MAG: hypothetical protein EBR86_07410 [Planctomycetia bacterium]|nr:hypothetical protein [Planctomycetia bacterium]
MGAVSVKARLWLVLALWSAGVAGAAGPDDFSWLAPDGGSSSRQARREAVNAMPLARLPAAQRQQVETCIRTHTLFRRLPHADIDCDAALLQFALEKPEVIVDIWRALGISQLALDPAGEAQWRLADGYGTVGILRLLHAQRRGDGGVLLFHGRGGYAGPLSPRPLSGTCVILVRHEPLVPSGGGCGRHRLTVDAFLDVDGLGLELVTRTLQPLVVRCAAANLHEIGLFMETLSATAVENPVGIERIASRLPRTPEEDRRTLTRIARRAAAAAGTSARGAEADSVSNRLAARWLPPAQPAGAK